MASRMERYQDPDQRKQARSRIERHKDLYEDFYTKTVFKEIQSTDEIISNDQAVDLTSMKLDKTTRENYHKMKEIGDFISPVEIKKTDELSLYCQQEEKEKNYDINSVLDEAKKNREEIDELEKKRKLKNTDYNILANLKPADIDLYQKKAKKKNKEDELEELIHTITSTSLKNKIEQQMEEDNKDLLSDLMPSSINETIISEELSKEILDKEVSENEKDEPEKNEVDRSFYTRSMDLSDADFDEEASDEFVEEKHSVAMFFKVLIVVISITAIIVAIFYLMNRL